MALSNWDTMAFDEEGVPTNGIIEGFTEGTSCEIYKNWLYVRDEDMWFEGRKYVKPTIAQIDSGEVMMSDFTIRAARGPQEGIFVWVESSRYVDKEYQVKRMAGIGASGYGDPFEKIIEEEGIDTEKWKPFTYGSHSSGSAVFTFTKGSGEDVLFKEIERDNYDDYSPQWTGITKETVEKFIEWLRSEGADEEWVDKIEKGEHVRFNQGDMFFNKNADVPLEATPPGSASEPVLARALRASSQSK